MTRLVHDLLLKERWDRRGQPFWQFADRDWCQTNHPLDELFSTNAPHRVEAEAANRSKLNDSLSWTPTACFASSTKSLFCQGLITLPSHRKETLHDLALLKELLVFLISPVDAVSIKTTEFAQSTPGYCKTWPYAKVKSDTQMSKLSNESV